MKTRMFNQIDYQAYTQICKRLQEARNEAKTSYGFVQAIAKNDIDSLTRRQIRMKRDMLGCCPSDEYRKSVTNAFEIIEKQSLTISPDLDKVHR